MPISIRQAGPQDIKTVSDILLEAASWLEKQGMPMWKDNELFPECIEKDVMSGLFFIAEALQEQAGVIKFQIEDTLFWPDVPQEESAFIHRLATRRKFSGGHISEPLLRWAAERTHNLGRRYLRLDCEASRPRLRAVYERFGFRHHSDKQVGPYFVSRYEFSLIKK